METVDFEAKQAAVGRFFSADVPDEWRQELMDRYGVVYVFYGPAERALGSFDPAAVLYLAPAFSQDAVTVYQVRSGRER